MSLRRALILAVVILSGCAPPRPEERQLATRLRDLSGDVEGRMMDESSISRHVVEAPVEAVWGVLPHVYQDFDIPLEFYDQEAALVGNRDFSPRQIGGRRMSFFLDCGSGGVVESYADSYRVTMFLVTSVKPAEENLTWIRTEIYATAMSREISGNRIHCTSRGVLERRLFEAVQDKLKG